MTLDEYREVLDRLDGEAEAYAAAVEAAEAAERR